MMTNKPFKLEADKPATKKAGKFKLSCALHGVAIDHRLVSMGQAAALLYFVMENKL